MNFKELSKEEQSQVIDLLQRTIKGEQFTRETFNGLSKNAIECFEQSLTKALGMEQS